MGTARAITDRSIWDYSIIMEVTIDRPAKDVWPYFFGDKKNIWTMEHFTTIAGEPGTVGEVYTQAYRGGQIQYETINVKPGIQLILKITYKQDEKDEERLVGYDFVTLNEVADHTKVVLQQAFALPVDIPKEDLAVETPKQDKKLADVLQNLKKLVENSK